MALCRGLRKCFGRASASEPRERRSHKAVVSLDFDDYLASVLTGGSGSTESRESGNSIGAALIAKAQENEEAEANYVGYRLRGAALRRRALDDPRRPEGLGRNRCGCTCARVCPACEGIVTRSKSVSFSSGQDVVVLEDRAASWGCPAERPRRVEPFAPACALRSRDSWRSSCARERGLSFSSASTRASSRSSRSSRSSSAGVGRVIRRA